MAAQSDWIHTEKTLLLKFGWRLWKNNWYCFYEQPIDLTLEERPNSITRKSEQNYITLPWWGVDPYPTSLQLVACNLSPTTKQCQWISDYVANNVVFRQHVLGWTINLIRRMSL